MNAIEIRNLTKNFGEKQALAGLNMTVPMGAIYGFIGENGSGKSTTEKIICGLLHKTGGEVKIFDKNYDGDITHLPSDSSLRRAYVELIKQGEKTGWGKGLFKYNS